MHVHRIGLALLVTLAATWLVPNASAQGVVSIDPRATFLHTYNDPALNAAGIALAAHGVVPGDSVTLRRLGDFDNGPGGDTFLSMLGVLSASNVLLASTLLSRVQDAVDTGTDYLTPATYYSSHATDIPQDFLISTTGMDSVTVYVPSGATHLFVCPPDQLFYDNADPDGDYAVHITRKAPVGVADPDTDVTSPAVFTIPSPARLPVRAQFTRPSARPVTLTVRDVRGRRVATLPAMAAGAREVVWDGATVGGGIAPAGLYVFSTDDARAVPGVRVIVLR